MIMRVIQMTPEQIAQMPPQERSGIVQLVSVFPWAWVSKCLWVSADDRPVQRATLGIQS